MPTPEISVVIPTRNRRALVSRALTTVLGQRNVDIEVFVVDEGSSDGSAELVRSLVARRLGGFDTRLSILADWEMWIRLFLDSPPAYVDRPIIGYSRHHESMSHLDEGFSAELDWIDEKHAETRRERGIRVHRDRWLKWAAASQMRAGKRQDALR